MRIPSLLFLTLLICSSVTSQTDEDIDLSDNGLGHVEIDKAMEKFKSFQRPEATEIPSEVQTQVDDVLNPTIQRDHINEDKQGLLIQDLARSEGLSAFASSMGTAQELDKRLEEALSPNSDILDRPVSLVPDANSDSSTQHATATKPLAANSPSAPADPSNTAMVLMFHMLPFLLRASYQTYHDLNEEEKLKLLGPDFVHPPKPTGGMPAEPVRTSSNMILPKEHYEGYNDEYYERMQRTKPINLWWNYRSKLPPPWFTNNAPPPRPHFMRAPIPVPKPPFRSPFNKQMFQPGYFQQKPPAWPTLHHIMVPGQRPGEGSMKCPCPENPMMLCDCTSVEYEDSGSDKQIVMNLEKKKRRQQGYDTGEEEPWVKLENDFVDNILPSPNLEAILALMSKRK